MKALKFFNLRGLNIFDQLCFEEYLLRNTNDNCVLFNTGIGVVTQSIIPTIVVGFSGKPAELINLDAALRDGVRMIRRYTGGGTVVVDHNTIFISFILNDSDVHDCPPFPRDIMRWTGERIYEPVFTSLLSNTDKRTFSQEIFSVRENDYVWGERKIGGNAQTITKGRWVHHTSFLWDYDPANMQRYLKMPAKRPDYRADRPHDAFLTPLKNKFDYSSVDSAAIAKSCRGCNFGLNELDELHAPTSTADIGYSIDNDSEGSVLEAKAENQFIQRLARSVCTQMQLTLGSDAVSHCMVTDSAEQSTGNYIEVHPIPPFQSRIPQKCCWSPTMFNAVNSGNNDTFWSYYNSLRTRNPKFELRTHYIEQ